MRFTPSILLCLMYLCGCASPTTSSVSSSSSGSTTAVRITGNWELVANSTQSSSAAPVGVYLVESGTTVTGMAVAPASSSYLGGELSGTIDESGDFTLRSSSGLTITGQATASGTLSGSYSISTNSYSDQGSVTGTLVQAVIGTYTGEAISSVTGAALNVTLILQQSFVPYSTGYLPVTGTLTFSPPCCSKWTASSGSFVLGNQYGLTLELANGMTAGDATGTISPDARTLSFTYSLSGDYGVGTLTLQ